MGDRVDGKGSGSCPGKKLGIESPKAINPLELICRDKGKAAHYISGYGNCKCVRVHTGTAEPKLEPDRIVGYTLLLFCLSGYKTLQIPPVTQSSLVH